MELSVLLEAKFDPEEKEKMKKLQDENNKNLAQIMNKEKFINDKTRRKIEINKKIKQIDTTINDMDLLEEEYKKRNEKLPLEKKIFSMRVLANIMVKEREEEFKKIDEINYLLKPKNFVSYKKELEKIQNYLFLAQLENIDEEIQKKMIYFQEVFLECFQLRVRKAKTPVEVLNLICEFRYYYLLQYDRQIQVNQVLPLQKKLEETISVILDKAKEQSVLHVYTSKQEWDKLIYKTIFNTRVINLRNIYIKITKEKDKFFLQVFDEDAFEERRELGDVNTINRKELEIKLNRKIKVFN